jgi:hypothetical protein
MARDLQAASANVQVVSEYNIGLGSFECRAKPRRGSFGVPFSASERFDLVGGQSFTFAPAAPDAA